MINKVAINVVGEELEAAADFCRAHGIGLEVTDFAFPRNLDNSLRENIQRHRQVVAGISPLISHGPCFDLIATSPDPRIVEITGERHSAALRAAQEIGATLYVAHTNFNPLIREPSYLNDFTRRMLAFWLPFADQAAKHEIVICLENVWEPGPEVQADLITRADHPGLRASFDNGHVLIFSPQPARVWIETLGAGLAHCHLHDNSGMCDEHKPVGEGKENWPELFQAIDRSASQAVLVAESNNLENNKLSLQRIRNFKKPA